VAEGDEGERENTRGDKTGRDGRVVGQITLVLADAWGGRRSSGGEGHSPSKRERDEAGGRTGKPPGTGMGEIGLSQKKLKERKWC